MENLREAAWTGLPILTRAFCGPQARDSECSECGGNMAPGRHTSALK
jgi:hypothetical protein